MKKTKQQKHCGKAINTFTFSDGSVLRKCQYESCTKFDAERQRVLGEPLKVVR